LCYAKRTRSQTNYGNWTYVTSIRPVRLPAPPADRYRRRSRAKHRVHSRGNGLPHFRFLFGVWPGARPARAWREWRIPNGAGGRLSVKSWHGFLTRADEHGEQEPEAKLLPSSVTSVPS